MSPTILSRSQLVITADDRGPAVGISAVVAVMFAAVALAIRIFSKSAMLHKMSLDDGIIFLAMVLAAAQTAMTVVEAQNGLGQHSRALAPVEQGLLKKAAYAADLLYIAVMPLAKISMALLMMNLAPFARHQRVAIGYIALVGVWGLVSVFVAAFLCRTGVPLLLESGVCFGVCFEKGLAFWNAFGALNLLSETFLILWPMFIFFEIQVNLKQRLGITAWFSTRLVTIAAIVTQLIYLNRLDSQLPERIYQLWILAICTACIQALSITTNCIPCMRPFLKLVNSGLMRSDILHGEQANGSYFSQGSIGGTRSRSVDSGMALGKVLGSIVDRVPRNGSLVTRPGRRKAEAGDSVGLAGLRRTSSQTRIIAPESPVPSSESVREPRLRW